MTSKIFTKQIEPHSIACYAVKNVRQKKWITEWGIPSPDLNWRDKSGGQRSRSVPFIEIRCNDSACPAVLLVKLDDLLEYISEQNNG